MKTVGKVGGSQGQTDRQTETDRKRDRDREDAWGNWPVLSPLRCVRQSDGAKRALFLLPASSAKKRVRHELMTSTS